jgi:nucleoside-diphosphate kinase
MSSVVPAFAHSSTAFAVRAPVARNSLRMAGNDERTYIMVKPDGVQRGLIGEIIGRFEQRGYQLKALKLIQPTEALLKEHYNELVTKSFFPRLLEYMLSGPVCAMVWEGKGVVATGRMMLGATNPQASAPGTIRGDYCIDVGKNICHGSDSVENAQREIGLWFSPEDLLAWESHTTPWLYE